MSDDQNREEPITLAEAARQRPLDPSEGLEWHEGFVEGAAWGAGWMAAIIGMAQAIADRFYCARCGGELERGVCESCDVRW